VLVDDEATRGVAQDVARLIGRDRVLEFDVDGFRMADEHRHPHAGRGQPDFGIKNLLGLHHHLPLFLGVAVLHEHVDLGMTLKAIRFGNFLLISSLLV
jgi:hypothetical protein